MSYGREETEVGRQVVCAMKCDRAMVNETEGDELAKWASSRREKVLSRTDARHVVVLAQGRQVLVQLLDAFLVSLDALAHQSLFELLSCCQHPSSFCSQYSNARTYALASGLFMAAFIFRLSIIGYKTLLLVLLPLF